MVLEEDQQEETEQTKSVFEQPTRKNNSKVFDPNSYLDSGQKMNSMIKQMKSHKNLTRVPTVSSIKDNKSSKFLHHGANKSGSINTKQTKGYSFSTVAKQDNKEKDLTKNQAMSEYRKAIEGTMKILDGANR